MISAAECGRTAGIRFADRDYASLTRRNCEGFCLPGNRPGLPVLHGGARRNRTDDLFNAMHASLPRSAASRNASVHQENELREVRLGLSNADRLHFSISGRPRCDHISPERRHRRRGCNHISFATGANPSARVRSRRRNVAQSVGSVCGSSRRASVLAFGPIFDSPQTRRTPKGAAPRPAAVGLAGKIGAVALAWTSTSLLTASPPRPAAPRSTRRVVAAFLPTAAAGGIAGCTID